MSGTVIQAALKQLFLQIYARKLCVGDNNVSSLKLLHQSVILDY